VTKTKETASTVNPNTSLRDLMLDCGKDKYRMVSLATRWAVEIQKRESQTGYSPDDLVNMSLKEILTGQVTLDAIEKLPPAPKLEKKLEVAAPVISEELAKRIAEEDARAEKLAKEKKDEPLEDEEEEDED
jgi:DNA-directed RNA polymerase subunit K/omega